MKTYSIRYATIKDGVRDIGLMRAIFKDFNAAKKEVCRIVRRVTNKLVADGRAFGLSFSGNQFSIWVNSGDKDRFVYRIAENGKDILLYCIADSGAEG